MKTDLVLAIFAATVFVCSCSRILDANDEIQACGEKLNFEMDITCSWLKQTRQKKLAPDSDSTEPWGDFQNLELTDESVLPIIHYGNKNSMVRPWFQRQRRGIVEECCKNRCSRLYMSTYCPY